MDETEAERKIMKNIKRLYVAGIMAVIIVFVCILYRGNTGDRSEFSTNLALSEAIEQQCRELQQKRIRFLEKTEEEEAYVSVIDIIKMSEDERRELLKKYSPLTGMILRKEEDRIQNTFFFPAGQKEADMTVRYDNWEFLMVNGNANDPLYDEKKYIWENVSFYCEYLFSYESGDLYVVWYPELKGSEITEQESDMEKRFQPVIAGVFFVTEKEIMDVRNYNTDNGSTCLYELDEADMLDKECGFTVCNTKPRDRVEWNADWRITIYQDNDCVVTDIKIDNDYYETYVWQNGVGLAGYQYGKYVGGDQHDFFTDKYILENYLHKGWEDESMPELQESSEVKEEMPESEEKPAIDYDLLDSMGYEIIEENVLATVAGNAREHPLLKEVLSTSIEDDLLSQQWFGTRPATMDYFVYDINDDGLEDYLVCLSGILFGGSNGDSFEIYAQEKDGSLKPVFYVSADIHYEEHSYYPIVILDNSNAGYHSFVLPWVNTIWSYDEIEERYDLEARLLDM